MARRFVVAWAVVVLPTAFHFLYSRLGYSPTDDGFILAYSRRLLRMQLPHRDFVSIRPVGSALLHLPELLFGPYTYWVSRWVVWTEFGVIGAAWLVTMTHTVGRRLPRIVELSLVSVAVILSAHTFPMMAWHTVDGATLSSAGIALCLSAKRQVRALGWVLLGLAPLCKQNFAIVSVAAAVLLQTGAWRERLWMALPGGAYFLVLFGGHGVTAAAQQLRAQSDLGRVAWSAYVDSSSFAWGVCSGLVITKARRWLRGLGAMLLLSLGTAVITYSVFVGDALFPAAPHFALAGCVVGIAAGTALWGDGSMARMALLGFVLCWATSISIGYNSPAVATGSAYLIVAFFLLADDRRPSERFSLQASLCGVALASLVWFGHARTHKIYREPAARHLTHRLGAILPGGRLLLADENTASFIADLNLAIARFGGARYSIIPDFPGWWAAARATNPLPLDWFYPVELPTTQLRSQVIDAIDGARGRCRLILQKVRADALAAGFVPLPESYSPIVQHVRDTWRPVGETDFFIVYE